MTPEQVEHFMRDLSLVCRKHKMALGGSPVVYIMKPEDFMFDYHLDEHSRLTLGTPRPKGAQA